MVSPEYNHAPSASLKNAIDWVYPEWNRKATTFVSYGGVCGARAVEHLRAIAAYAGSVGHPCASCSPIRAFPESERHPTPG